MFAPGNLVVCQQLFEINTDLMWRGFHVPTFGLVYTVRAIYPLMSGNKKLQDVLLLEEIRNPVLGNTTFEPGFNPLGFRLTKKISIDSLRVHLDPEIHG